jgi:F0F1-type ATP synthase assembly protein I
MEEHKKHPMAEAMEWVSKIMSVGIMMAVFPVIGTWIDNKAGTAPTFVLILGIVGMFAGFYQLLSVTGALKNAGNTKKSSQGSSRTTRED